MNLNEKLKLHIRKEQGFIPPGKIELRTGNKKIETEKQEQNSSSQKSFSLRNLQKENSFSKKQENNNEQKENLDYKVAKLIMNAIEEKECDFFVAGIGRITKEYGYQPGRHLYFYNSITKKMEEGHLNDIGSAYRLIDLPEDKDSLRKNWNQFWYNGDYVKYNQIEVVSEPQEGLGYTGMMHDTRSEHGVGLLRGIKMNGEKIKNLLKEAGIENGQAPSNEALDIVIDRLTQKTIPEYYEYAIKKLMEIKKKREDKNK